MKKTILAMLVAGAAIPAFAADKMDISFDSIAERAPVAVSTDAPATRAPTTAATPARTGPVATSTPGSVGPSANESNAKANEFPAPRLETLPQLQSLGSRPAPNAGASDAHVGHLTSVPAQTIQHPASATVAPKVTTPATAAPKVVSPKTSPGVQKEAAEQKPSDPVGDVSAGGQPQTAPVNPFTGNSLAAEDIQRQIDHSKSQTALLQEQLKQVTLQQDISNLPYKKRAELVQMASNNPVLQGMLGIQPVAPVVPASAPKVVKTAPKKKVAPATGENAGAVAHTPSVTLNGIVVDQGNASALLTIDGSSVIAPNGASTPFGRVQILNQRSANIGGQMLTVHEDTVSRMVISDPKPVDPKAMQAFGSLPQALPKPVFNAGPLPALPPLPLPPTK